MKKKLFNFRKPVIEQKKELWLECKKCGKQTMVIAATFFEFEIYWNDLVLLKYNKPCPVSGCAETAHRVYRIGRKAEYINPEHYFKSCYSYMRNHFKKGTVRKMFKKEGINLMQNSFKAWDGLLSTSYLKVFRNPIKNCQTEEEATKVMEGFKPYLVFGGNLYERI